MPEKSKAIISPYLLLLVITIDLSQFLLLTEVLYLYRTEEEAGTSIPRLILSQFRWLDNIVDNNGLVKKLLETLEACPPELQVLFFESFLQLRSLTERSNHNNSRSCQR